MRIVYLGTSQFAVAVLESLAESRHLVELVVTMPDRPKGRGRKVAQPPVAVAAEKLEIPLKQPKSVNSEECRSEIGRVEPDVVCVCAYGGLIKEPLLSDHSMLNVHPSLLPRWRGAAPIERSIMAGDEKTGVTIMRVTAGLDSGPVALQASIDLGQEADCREISAKLERLGGDLLIDAMDAADSGRLELVEQDDDLATYAEKIEAVDRELDFGRSAIDLVNQVRALSPHIGAYALDEHGGRIKVLRAKESDQVLGVGEVLDEEKRIVIGCGKGSIELLEIQAPGKTPTPVDDYLRGNPAPVKFDH